MSHLNATVPLPCPECGYKTQKTVDCQMDRPPSGLSRDGFGVQRKDRECKRLLPGDSHPISESRRV